MVAAGISIGIGDWIEAVVILLVVVTNVVIGFVQVNFKNTVCKKQKSMF